MSASKDEPNARPEGAKAPKGKRKKDKLIRLDDLLPKGDVTGGRQLFGATDDIKQDQNREQQ